MRILMIRLLTLCALTAIAVSAQTDAAHAQSPQDIAARCVGEVNETVERCRRAAAAEVKECVPLIRRLVEAGEIDRARAVARKCVTSAEERTKRCVDHVHTVCRRCVALLLNLGASELARRVAFICEDAIEDLRHILQREKHAIETALQG
jgi:hypothetical protein